MTGRAITAGRSGPARQSTEPSAYPEPQRISGQPDRHRDRQRQRQQVAGILDTHRHDDEDRLSLQEHEGQGVAAHQTPSPDQVAPQEQADDRHGEIPRVDPEPGRKAHPGRVSKLGCEEAADAGGRAQFPANARHRVVEAGNAGLGEGVALALEGVDAEQEHADQVREGISP